MTFRTRLFVNFMLALLLAVGLIAAGVTVVTRRAFDELNREHTDALLAQFQREFDRAEAAKSCRAREGHRRRGAYGAHGD